MNATGTGFFKELIEESFTSVIHSVTVRTAHISSGMETPMRHSSNYGVRKVLLFFFRFERCSNYLQGQGNKSLHSQVKVDGYLMNLELLEIMSNQYE